MRRLIIFLLVLIPISPIPPAHAQVLLAAPVGEVVEGTLNQNTQVNYGVDAQNRENYEPMVLLNITSNYPINLDISQSKDNFSIQKYYFGTEFLTVFYFNYISGVLFEISANQDNTNYRIETTEIIENSQVELEKPGYLSFGDVATQFNFSLNQSTSVRVIYWGLELISLNTQGVSNGSESLSSLSDYGYKNMKAKTQVLDLDAGDYTIDVSSNIDNILSTAILITTTLDFYESNDDFESAKEILAGQQIWGRMDEDVDEDWYTISGPFKGALHYTYFSPSGAALDGGEFATAIATESLDNSEGIFVAVEPGDDFTFGVFSSSSNFDYRILVEVVEPDTYEPVGETKRDAIHVSGEIRKLSLHDKGDTDWFTFHLDQFSEVEIIVSYDESKLFMTLDIEGNEYYDLEKFSNTKSETASFEGGEGDYYFYIDTSSILVPEYSIFIRITLTENTHTPSTSVFKILFSFFPFLVTLVLAVKITNRSVKISRNFE